MAEPLKNLPPAVAQALARGNLIEAIRLLRQQHPELGLAELKSLVEAMQRQGVKVDVKTNVKASVSHASAPGSSPHVPHPHAPMPLPPELTPAPGLSPGEMPRSSIHL